MSTFVLVHGASANAGYWRLVVPRLVQAGHVAVAVDLPTSDETADFETYADAVAAAADGRRIDVVVGQSMGAFTVGVVAERLRPRQVVLVNPMTPLSGESPQDWSEAVGQQHAVEEYSASIGVLPEFDPVTTLFHDVPGDLANQLWSEGEPPQARGIFAAPFSLEAWPDVATRVVAGTGDRLFPFALQQRVTHDRLKVSAEPIACGHLAAFASPDALTRALLS